MREEKKQEKQVLNPNERPVKNVVEMIEDNPETATKLVMKMVK